MVPTAEQIASNRQLIAAIVRLTGIVTASIAVYQWCYEIEYTLNAVFMYPVQPGAATVQPPSVGRQVWDAMSWSSLVLFLPGLTMAIAAHRIARLFIRLPKRQRCPSCSYVLTGLSQPKCPECGLHLSDAFRANPGDDPEAA